MDTAIDEGWGDEVYDQRDEAICGDASEKKLSGHSTAHLKWAEKKQKAAKNGADLSKLGSDSLGAKLDNFRQLFKGAIEVSRLYSKLDDRTLKPVREARKKVEDTAHAYETKCRTLSKDASLSQSVRDAWSELADAANHAGLEPKNTANSYNNGVRQKDNLPEIKIM